MWRGIESRALFGVFVLLVMVASATEMQIVGDQKSILKQLDILKNPYRSQYGNSLSIGHVTSRKKKDSNERKGIIWDKKMQSDLQKVQENCKFSSIKVLVFSIVLSKSEFKVSVDVPTMEFTFEYPLDTIRPKSRFSPKNPFSLSSKNPKPTGLEFSSSQLKVLIVRCPGNNSPLVDHLRFSNSVEELSVNAGLLSDFAFFLSHYSNLKTYRFLNILEAKIIERNQLKSIGVRLLNRAVEMRWDEIVRQSRGYTTLEIWRLPENTESSSGSIPPENQHNVAGLPQLQREISPETIPGNETTSLHLSLRNHGANSTLPNDSAPSKLLEPRQELQGSVPSASIESMTLGSASHTRKWLKDRPMLHADPTVEFVLHLSILIGVCFFFPIIVALSLYRWAISSYRAEVVRAAKPRGNVMYI